MNNGYIKLFRKMLDWYGFSSSKRVHLLLTLLLLASHKKKTVMWNGKPIEIVPGQFITGRLKLKELCSISESYIEKLLEEFEKMEILRQRKSSISRLITIVGWSQYQSSDNGEDNGEDNGKTTERTTERHNQEYKERKNERRGEAANAAHLPAGSNASVANPPAVKILSSFCEIYNKYTGIKYRLKSSDRLIFEKMCATTEIDQIKNKITTFATMCHNQTAWFTKSWADFTVTNLDKNWNSIIPEATQNV